MSDKHRLSVYSEKRLPRQKKTIKLRGEKDDTGKWCRCWNCGMPARIDRETLQSGERGRTGVIVSTFVDDDGETKYYPDVIGGCFFCGCTQWRG